MALEETLKEFCRIFGRGGFDLGSVSFAPDAANSVPPEIQLTGQIEEFYASLDFDELSIGGILLMEIFSAERLPDAQLGWRWVTGANGQTTEDTENWNENWLVFADRNGDAIFVKTDDPLSPVCATIQKTRNFQLADSLEDFFKILNECLVIEENDFDLEGETEDFQIKPDLLERITKVLDEFAPRHKDDFLEFFFG